MVKNKRDACHSGFSNKLCPQRSGSQTTSVELQGQKHPFHRDVVCRALLVTGRLIFMFWLNKQLTTLSIVSCFAPKTQLANTVDEQVES